MFSAVVLALVSTTSSMSSGPSHAASICSASLGPLAGDHPLNTTTRGGLRSANRAAVRTQSSARGPIR
jgi:hypothetical protein